MDYKKVKKLLQKWEGEPTFGDGVVNDDDEIVDHQVLLVDEDDFEHAADFMRAYSNGTPCGGYAASLLREEELGKIIFVDELADAALAVASWQRGEPKPLALGAGSHGGYRWCEFAHGRVAVISTSNVSWDDEMDCYIREYTLCVWDPDGVLG